MHLDATKLRRLMDDRGLSQTDLASAAGLSRVRLGSLLRDPSARVRRGTEGKLCSALGLPPGSLDKSGIESAYLGAVAERHGFLDFVGLGVVNNAEPLPMHGGFVPLEVQRWRRDVEGQSGSCQEQAKRPVHLERGTKDPANDRNDDDSANQRSGLSYSLGEAMERWRRFVLLGHPGQGKTTILRHCAHSYTTRQQNGHSYPGEPLVPIFIPLASWAETLREDGDWDVASAALIDLDVPDPKGTSEWLRKSLSEGNGLLLLDGLDEVVDEEDEVRVIEAIRSCIREYPEARLVVSSRIVGFQSPRLSRDMAVLTVQPLSIKAVRDFVKYWLAFRHGHEAAKNCRHCGRRLEEFCHAIVDHDEIRSLARNPMLLTILVLLHEAGASLPRRRWDLYEKISEGLLFTWQEKKRSRFDPEQIRKSRLDDRELRWLLQSIAFEMQKRDFTLVPRWWLTRHIAAFLREELTFPAEKASAEVDTLIFKLTREAGILTERGRDRFCFAHLAFQEFYAACAVLYEDDSIESLRPYLYHPRWREVVRLVSSRLKPRRAPQLLRMLLDDPDPTGRFIKRGLLIALECLADGAPVHDAELLKTLEDEVAELGTSRWLGIAFDATENLGELLPTRMEGFARRAFEAMCQVSSTALPPEAHISLRIQGFAAGFADEETYGTGELDNSSDRDEAIVEIKKDLGDDHSVSVILVSQTARRQSGWMSTLLKKLEKDSSELIRAKCVDELSRFARGHTKAREALIRTLLDREERTVVRECAANALPRTGRDNKVKRALLEVLEREDEVEVRKCCGASLGAVAAHDKGVRELLVSLVHSGEPTEARSGAARGLRRCALSDRAVLDLLLKTLRDETEAEAVRVACLWSLETVVSSDSSVLEGVIDALSDHREGLTQRVAAQILAKHASIHRNQWGQLPIERIEQILVSVKEPCSQALSAIRGLVDAREIGPGGVMRERRIRDALREVADRIRVAFLFGSVARGEQRPDSDIDLMIVGDISLRTVTPCLKNAEQQLGRQINPVVFRPEQWKERITGKDPFVLGVLGQKRIPVMGSIDELAAMA